MISRSLRETTRFVSRGLSRRSPSPLAWPAAHPLRTATARPPPAPPLTPIPVTVGSLTLDKRPERIVSLSATATEMLFAIDAGQQVVAVDEFSTYPADAPKTTLSGFKPNAEAIAGYNPDLVVLSDDMENIVSKLTDSEDPDFPHTGGGHAGRDVHRDRRSRKADGSLRRCAGPEPAQSRTISPSW